MHEQRGMGGRALELTHFVFVYLYICVFAFVFVFALVLSTGMERGRGQGIGFYPPAHIAQTFLDC